MTRTLSFWKRVIKTAKVRRLKWGHCTVALVSCSPVWHCRTQESCHVHLSKIFNLTASTQHLIKILPLLPICVPPQMCASLLLRFPSSSGSTNIKKTPEARELSNRHLPPLGQHELNLANRGKQVCDFVSISGKEHLPLKSCYWNTFTFEQM